MTIPYNPTYETGPFIPLAQMTQAERESLLGGPGGVEYYESLVEKERAEAVIDPSDFDDEEDDDYGDDEE